MYFVIPKNIRYVIGIDPGVKGAISIIDLRSGEIFLYDCPLFWERESKKKFDSKTGRMIDSYRDRLSSFVLTSILEPFKRNSVCIIEHSHAMPEDAVASAFHYGEGYGIYLGVLASLGINYIEVEAQTWKKSLDLNSDKIRSIMRALSWKPQLNRLITLIKHDGRAEALLLIKYFIEEYIDGSKEIGRKKR